MNYFYKNHGNKHPEHNNKNLKLSEIKPDEEELPLLKSNLCKNELNKDQQIPKCLICKDLCNDCANNHAITKPNYKISLIKYDIPETDKDKERNPKVRIGKKKKPIYIKDKTDDKISDNELAPNVKQYPKWNCAVCNDIPANNI